MNAMNDRVKKGRITALIPVGALLTGIVVYIAALYYESKHYTFESLLLPLVLLGTLFLEGVSLIVCVPLTYRQIKRWPTPKWMDVLFFIELIAAVILVIPTVIAAFAIIRSIIIGLSGAV